MSKSAKNIEAIDAKRNIGEELLSAIRDVNAGKT